VTSAPLILVTGVPGAGKSTLARQLATSLDAALLSLDEIKESLYEAGAHLDDRMALRLAAEQELARRAAAEPRAVVVDIWVAPGRDEARTARWIGPLARPVVEVLCRVPAGVAVARYRSRRRAGPHLPPDADMLCRIETAAAAIAPQCLGPTVEVDTVGVVDVNRLVKRIIAVAGHRQAG
jgi:predicted kinase